MSSSGRPDLESRDAARRVDTLVAAMTLEEKIARVHGVNFENNTGYVPPTRRLGIGSISLTDGPAGVWSGAPAPALPAAVAVAATFDRLLMRDYGTVLGREARFAGQQVIFAPGVNIVRVPYGGRNFEYFGEDPVLAARTTAQVVSGIQSQGTAACVKHYLCNNTETDRKSVNVRVDERTLREIYLPAFQAAVKDARVACVMVANNRFDGDYCAENPRALRSVLRSELGFDGVILADYSATHNAVGAANAGLDLDLPTGRHFGEPLRRAVLDGLVAVAELDDKVRRILLMMDRFGFLTDPAENDTAVIEASRARHRLTARQVGVAGSVLLRNVNDLLPVDPQQVRSIALLGRYAKAPKIGGRGSSRVVPLDVESPLRAIAARAPGVRVTYAEGADPGEPYPVPYDCLSVDRTGLRNGLTGEYFASSDLSGPVVIQRTDPYLNVHFGQCSPGKGLTNPGFSARWSGFLTPAVDGVHELILQCDSEVFRAGAPVSAGGSRGGRLFLDGELIVDHWDGSGSQRIAVDLVAGRAYRCVVEYHHPTGGFPSQIALFWEPPDGAVVDPQGALARAAAAAGEADLAVVFVGTHEQEHFDRTDLRLPGNQEDLILAAANANPNTIVVQYAGSVVDMRRWHRAVPAILHGWYPGGEAGGIVTDLLFGDASPSGRLPVTFGADPADYPANSVERFPGTDGEQSYGERVFVGYRHFDAAGIEPLFPFGHGLSYTEFEYGDITVPSTMEAGTDLRVRVAIRNCGARAGAEVVQLYVGFLDAGVPMPPAQLKGFERVALIPGESAEVEIAVGPADLSIWEPDRGRWASATGRLQIMVGSSSRDIRQVGTVTVRPAETGVTDL